MLRRGSVSLASACLLALTACDDAITAPPAPATSEPAITAADVREAPGRALTAAQVAASVVQPALPERLTLPTDAVVTGKTFRPADVSALYAALREAQPGDQILLTPGASYVGYFRLRDKGNTSGWITVRTDGTLPAAGTRVTPAMAGRFAKLVAQGRNDPAISADTGTRGWRFIGVEVMPHDSIKTLGALIRLSDGSAREMSQIPSDIVFDRTYIHGNTKVGLTRCIMLNSARTAVVNSTVTECHRNGFDSHAIGTVASPGPVLIENNSLSGAGMGIFIGGSDPRIANLSPSDITIRNNHIWRPASWKGVWTVKNLLEFKHAKRVLVEGNLFENNWADAQTGTAIVIKSTNQYGRAPWSQTADVTFRRNILRNSPNAVTLAANPEKHPAVPAARIKIEHNLFYNIGSYAGTRGGRMFVMGGPLSDVQLLNNTMIHNDVDTHAAIMDPSSRGQASRFVARGNIGTLGASGWMSSGEGSGTAAFKAMWRDTYVFENNVIIGSISSRFPYPVTTKRVATLAEVGFANAGSGDFTLLSSSPFAGAAGALLGGALGGTLPIPLVGGGN
jgi:hypothetical protein